MKRDSKISGRPGEIAIYVHVPFCVSKCSYCDFLSFPTDSPSGSQRMIDAYFDALKAEIDATPRLGRRISSIYFGGGTPSRPDPSHISSIMDSLRTAFAINEDAEVSIEANPGTLSDTSVRSYLEAGINRMSIGVQSFDDRELAVLGRIHTAENAVECYAMARDAGVTNLNIDLIAALPGQDKDSLLRTVRRAVSLGPEHISLYSLIIEPGTPFYERYSDQVPDPHFDRPVKTGGKGSLPTEDDEREMMHAAWEELEDAGYGRYEISNFERRCKSERGRFRCRQNITYWERGEYLGFGLGAASLMDGTRFSNVCDITEYIGKVKASGKAVDEETVQVLTDRETEAEYMFLGLRMTEGVSEERFLRGTGRSIDEAYGDELRKLTDEGLLERRNGRVFLTSMGTDIANMVMAEFV